MPSHELFYFETSLEALSASLGKPPFMDDDPFPGIAVGPTAIWLYPMDCGLSIGVGYAIDLGRAAVYANIPEIDHVIAHLPMRLPQIHRYDEEDPAYFNRLIVGLPRFELWRQDDGGNSFKVATLYSRTGAECLMKFYEDRGHKQVYWVKEG